MTTMDTDSAIELVLRLNDIVKAEVKRETDRFCDELISCLEVEHSFAVETKAHRRAEVIDSLISAIRMTREHDG